MRISLDKNSKYIQILGSVILFLIILILYLFQKDLRWAYCCVCVLVWLMVLPKKLMNPKNIVFFYYFVFYGFSPALANRYKDVYDVFGSIVNDAYLMCTLTYIIIMLTLHLGIGEYEKKNVFTNKIEKNVKLNTIDVFMLFCVFLMMLYIYIQKTGGLELWLTDANAAFFSRRGSGMYYIGFTHILMILLFCQNANKIEKKRDILERVFYILLLIVSSRFIGSRSTTFIMLLLLFSRVVMEMHLFNIKSVVLVLSGIGIFVFGMFVRAGSVMQNLSAVISTCLNYFDTFENLLISLRDFPPNFGKTIFLPFNWILMKFGTYMIEPYHDMSIWLTNIYYPESWINGGTTQWPIETDMYMSFYFWGGFPFLILYFFIIAYVYKKSQNNSIWRLIYINEAMLIISHLRGGLFIYWYFWLIPMYLWLLIKYKEIKVTK